MSTIVNPTAAAPATIELSSHAPLDLIRSRAMDYLILSKPRIAVMSLIVVTIGYALGCRGNFDLTRLWQALLGIGAIAAGCSVLNQWWERETDSRMRRTARRPLPQGRIPATEALLAGLLVTAFGTVWLLAFVNTLTALLTLATLVAYVGVYTPLKRKTSLCTAIGAIPGAMPPVLGWAAADGGLEAGALALFGILFLWQFPHFLAIAWMYREDYAQAGLHMLPRRQSSSLVGVLAVTYALVLIPVSMLPQQLGYAGEPYFWTALVLGLAYLAASLKFARQTDRGTARRLLLTSLVYLPLLLGVLTADHWRLLS